MLNRWNSVKASPQKMTYSILRQICEWWWQKKWDKPPALCVMKRKRCTESLPELKYFYYCSWYVDKVHATTTRRKSLCASKGRMGRPLLCEGWAWRFHRCLFCAIKSRTLRMPLRRSFREVRARKGSWARPSKGRTANNHQHHEGPLGFACEDTEMLSAAFASSQKSQKSGRTESD